MLDQLRAVRPELAKVRDQLDARRESLSEITIAELDSARTRVGGAGDDAVSGMEPGFERRLDKFGRTFQDQVASLGRHARDVSTSRGKLLAQAGDAYRATAEIGDAVARDLG